MHAVNEEEGASTTTSSSSSSPDVLNRWWWDEFYWEVSRYKRREDTVFNPTKHPPNTDPPPQVVDGTVLRRCIRSDILDWFALRITFTTGLDCRSSCSRLMVTIIHRSYKYCCRHFWIFTYIYIVYFKQIVQFAIRAFIIVLQCVIVIVCSSCVTPLDDWQSASADNQSWWWANRSRTGNNNIFNYAIISALADNCVLIWSWKERITRSEYFYA